MNGFLLVATLLAYTTDPPLTDLVRFPDESTTAWNIRWNQDFQEAVIHDYPFRRAYTQDFNDALLESRELYGLWDTLLDAHCCHASWETKKDRLRTLRDRIGAEAYFHGRMPPPIPMWLRFRD
jgi:hypothetical protein